MGHISLTWILGNRFMAVLTLLAGVGLVAFGVLAVAAEAPDGDRDLRAYEAAARCPAAPPAPAECRWAQEFTVSAIRLTNKRGEVDGATLTSMNGTRWETSYPSRGPVLNLLREGDQVTGTIWRGELTEIAAEGAAQKTSAAPADMRTRALIGALITVPGGLLMAVACTWRLARRTAPTQGMVATLGLAFGLFAAGLCSPLVLAHREESFWLVAAVWLPLAAVLTAVARSYATRKHTATV